MKSAELDALLRKFLIDRKLIAAERQQLAQWLKVNLHDPNDHRLARHVILESVRQLMQDSQAVDLLQFVEDALDVLDSISQPGSPHSTVAFSPGDACLSLIINRIHSARSTADICVFTITDDRITRAILDAHRRGVKVRIITDNEKAYDLGSDVEKFLQAKVPLKVDDSPYHMHHKFAIIDGNHLLNGSYNWTRGAAENNIENVTDTTEPELIREFQNQFNLLWTKLAPPKN